MPKRGKNYKTAVAGYDKQTLFDVKEAFEILDKFPKAKFDETVEAHIKLGVDSRPAG